MLEQIKKEWERNTLILFFGVWAILLVSFLVFSPFNAMVLGAFTFTGALSFCLALLICKVGYRRIERLEARKWRSKRQTRQGAGWTPLPGQITCIGQSATATQHQIALAQRQQLARAVLYQRGTGLR